MNVIDNETHVVKISKAGLVGEPINLTACCEWVWIFGLWNGIVVSYGIFLDYPKSSFNIVIRGHLHKSLIFSNMFLSYLEVPSY